MRWRRFFQSGRQDREFAREIESYVTHETEENIARGMSRDEARLAALRKFGNRTQAHEALYHI